MQDSLIKFLTAKADLFKDQFSKHIATISARSLNDIHRLTGRDSWDNSLRKRTILGDALNAFNREINKAFFNTWFYAKSLLNGDPKVPSAIVSNTMITVLNDLYKTFSTQRMQLFIAAGYLNKEQLDQDELVRFEPIINDQGQELFCPDNLHNVLRQRSRTARSGQLNDFLSNYTHCLTTAPTTLPRCLDAPSAPPAKAAECTPVADKLLLLSLFHQEKERFIADVQRLYLDHADQFDDLPHEAASEQPWHSSGFDAPLSDPGDYRSAFPRPKQASLPGPPTPALSAGARQVTNAFSSTAHKIVQQTLKKTEQSSSKSQSVPKRVLLGDALNALNNQFDQQFLTAFDRAHRGLPATDEQPSAPLSTKDLNPVFQQMLSTLADQRMQLFVDAGYIETDRLSTIEIVRLRRGHIDKDGRTIFFPAYLIKLIRDEVRLFDPHDPFDEFLIDFTESTIENSNIPRRRRPDDYLKTDTLHGTQQLARILAKDKTNFINTVQALLLRDNSRFNDELSLDENHLSELFAPDTFLDIVKNPDAYRNASSHIPTCWPASRQNGITTAPMVSSAIRPQGALNDLKESLVALFSPAIDSHSQPDTATYSPHFDHTGNLVLATLLTTRFHDRQLSIQQQLVMPGQDPLSQSPGMRLLTESQAISARLQAETKAFINQLETSDGPISAYWNQDDLVNIAILQSTTATSDAVTECFLYEVLRSPHIGIKRERPENVFAADGRVRGSNDQYIFHHTATGKTSPGGTAGALARTMLQAMAIQRLASDSQINQPDGLHGEIIRQVSELYQRQETTVASVLIPGYGNARPSVAEITEIIQKRLASKMQLMTPRAQLDPVLGTLKQGLFAKGRKLFMQLSPMHQMESVLILAVENDYLGMSFPTARLKKLQTDVLYRGIESDWQRFAYGEQAWELLTNLYDRKIAAPEEAINRINVQTMINRHGINDADEAMQLRQLLVQLLPGRTSASNFTRATQQTTGLQPPVKLHQFEPGRIAGMISDYQTIKTYLDQHCFPKLFGNTITDPQLRSEVISTVARITLDACMGSIALQNWQPIAVKFLAREYVEFKFF